MTIRSFILTLQALQNGEDSLFKKWCWENWAATHKRIKVDYLLTLCTKLNSKQMKGMSVSLETIKLLEENTGSKLSNINLTNFFFVNMSPQARETRTQVNTWEHIKLKSFCTARKSIKKPIQVTYWIGEDTCKQCIW